MCTEKSAWYTGKAHHLQAATRTLQAQLWGCRSYKATSTSVTTYEKLGSYVTFLYLWSLLAVSYPHWCTQCLAACSIGWPNPIAAFAVLGEPVIFPQGTGCFCRVEKPPPLTQRWLYATPATKMRFHQLISPPGVLDSLAELPLPGAWVGVQNIGELLPVKLEQHTRSPSNGEMQKKWPPRIWLPMAPEIQHGNQSLCSSLESGVRECPQVKPLCLHPSPHTKVTQPARDQPHLWDHWTQAQQEKENKDEIGSGMWALAGCYSSWVSQGKNAKPKVTGIVTSSAF